MDATAPSPLRLSGAERDWVVSLGDAARELLMDAARDKNGVVIVVSTMDGDSVRTNEREFVDHGVARSEARWRGAVRELSSAGVLEDRTGKGEIFFVTDHGFRLADLLERSRPA